ncbi:MAG: ATP-binding protein, partial [Actinobacteria bacterium]|nr:ATP-binding protein [Actinomycetota bacterium]
MNRLQGVPEADRVRRVMDRLAEARSQLCVGRDNERSRMAALLTAGGPAVVFVHGPAGIGKSVLVDAVVASTQRQVVRLDARRVEPTPTAFLDASAAAIGTGAATPVELGDAMQRLGAPLLVIDGYERLRLIDDWIRDHLVPALP